MASICLTDQQRRAVRTTGRSVIVSAAAGSGKTAVLAERCAYLVCDAPPEAMCSVDELLVLTFTEAAAAEMRSRIVEAIRTRLEARPADARLRDQAALVDAAQISTVHAFCLWLIRRWFSDLGIDPTATVLDEDETRLLKSEVLDALINDLYDVTQTPGEPLGTVAAPEQEVVTASDPVGPTFQSVGKQPKKRVPELGQAFVKLVNDYGLGDDRDLARFVLKLFDFTMSLPDPERWLREAHESVAFHPERLVVAMVQEFPKELNWQAEHCEQIVAMLEAGDSVGHFYAEQIRAYGDQLFTWAEMLEGSQGGPEPRASARADGQYADDLLTRFEAVRQQIAGFQFSRATGPRLSKGVDPAVKAARDAAGAQLTEVKKRLFGERLKKRFGLFSVEECSQGLKKTAPYVATLVDLANAFRDAYTAKKREMNVLDFADLERLAFDLLRSEEAPEKPSEAARTLHRRFAHVLVDEFQDINPIQQAIIRLASRECDPDRPNNLFVVGDVKQSIYRFRLAEPEVFTRRLHGFRDGTEDGVAISLQRNFRSRSEILEAINLVFRGLMREGTGNIVYDAEAELRPAREIEVKEPHQPVEVHLLERSWDGPAQADQIDEMIERGVADLNDPARWAPIEREAFLIGSRIRDLMASGGLTPDGRPLRYRDIAVLLRARRINAERMAAMMTSMGIPAYADVGGSLFGAREVRDVLAALQLFDNFQQDIPLAAVLRSGILGEALSADELVEIRCLDRNAPFQEAVREYARRGENAGLRERLVALIDHVNHYRSAVRRRPLADVLWDLYGRQGYLAYAGGLPNGPQRRANLLKLHELARQFGSFRRQGLHRFLRFVRSLEEENQEMAVAPAISEADDVVRIMSIHQAKGLEFPVVFVAGLGTRFNLGDRQGRMIFERTARIGLRIVDTERMIEYPTVAHRQAASEIERATRDEELRVLYVAMTRARDKLILIGSQHNVGRYTHRVSLSSENSPPSRFVVATATTPLDWLMPALAGAPKGVVRGLGGKGKDGPRENDRALSKARSLIRRRRTSRISSANPLFDVHLHTVEEMAGWCVRDRGDEQDRATRRAVARCEALPAHEPLAPHDPAVEQVLSQLEYVYPSLSSASVRASMAASEFQGAYDYTRNPEHRPDRFREDDFQVPPSKYDRLESRPHTMKPDEAAYRGVVTHRILQHLDFSAAVDASGVASELQRMVAAGVVTGEDCAAVDRGSIEWFVSTPLAEAIRRAGDAYRREFMYIATEPLDYFDADVDSPSDDSVLVRGIVDAILPIGEWIEIVDYKTDVILPAEVAKTCEQYRPQMELYARAMSRIWRRPVRACWLVFLAAKNLVKWKPPGESRQHSAVSFQPDR